MSDYNHNNIWNNKIDWKMIDGNRTAICMLPPPNVTGSLHIGHALNITLQDIKLRYLSLKDKKSLWISGTDHAGIATQLVAQRLLAKDGIDYKTLTTETFKQYIQQVKENHESIVCDQILKMDTVINWDAYCFTLDTKVCESVFLTFKKLFDEGLIYKAMRLTNWDAKLQTALSDLEVEYKTISGNLYYIEYDTDFGTMTTATTRPETMLGDNALCVHPDDERYKHLVGKFAYIPITNKAIPIIADKLVDMEFGTGVLKVTCAHAVEDFELGKVHNLECYNIIDKTGVMINVPEEFAGLNCDEARVKIVEVLTHLNVLKKIEPIKHQVPYGEKSGNKLECILTEQWFINMQPIAEKSLAKLDDIKFYPEYFKNNCRQALEKIEPWCISRQLIWGHQIPIWYVRNLNTCNEKMFVCRDKTEAEEQAQAYFQTDIANLTFEQDKDVLDTWFSSALWPFATQNFPYDEFIVNDFLVTGKDILFFWVARMIMMTVYMCDQMPFREVYLHGLVMDEHGKKMSKMVGNVLNPLDIIKEYNSDVIKLGLISKLIQGRNVAIGKQNMELERNFLTKVENAVKFCVSQQISHANLDTTEMNEDNAVKVSANDILNAEDIPNIQLPNIQLHKSASYWILSRMNETISAVAKHLDAWEMSEALMILKEFFKNDFCDWFIEASKIMMKTDSFSQIQRILRFVMHRVLIILYPYAPIKTQQWLELLQIDLLSWNQLEYNDHYIHTDHCAKDIQYTQDLFAIIAEIRSLKSIGFMNVIEVSEHFKQHEINMIHGLTKCTVNTWSNTSGVIYNTSIWPQHAIKLFTVNVDQLQQIHEKCQKEIVEQERVLEMTQKRLSDKIFLEKADAQVIDDMKIRVQSCSEMIINYKKILQLLQS